MIHESNGNWIRGCDKPKSSRCESIVISPNLRLGSRWCIYEDHAESNLIDLSPPRPPF